MNIELVNTGTELILGQAINSHLQWLGRQLADLGLPITRQVAIPDNGPAIEQAVREALSRADLILVTGGLGPTADDVTRDCIAALLGRPLHEDARVLRAMEDFYAARGRTLLPSARVQALVPEGSRVLPNLTGTAPGLALEVAPNPWRQDQRPSLLVMLPGPPRELYPMFTQQVVPLLRQRISAHQAFFHRTFKTTGLPESAVEAAVAGALQNLVQSGLELGYCARVGEVEVHLAARGSQAQALLDQAEPIVRARLEAHIFSGNDDSLEAVVVKLLTERNLTLSVAESCTGGYLAHRLTNVPGASAVFMAGLVTYSNQAKQRWLGVRADIIESHGAVSEPTARAMAEGARQSNQTDYALAITGIAGPAGGTPDKPVGTVFIALATPNGTTVQRQINRFERENFKQATCQQALEMLRQALRMEARTVSPVGPPQA